jgi:hypothetical protein
MIITKKIYFGNDTYCLARRDQRKTPKNGNPTVNKNKVTITLMSCDLTINPQVTKYTGNTQIGRI